MLRPVLFPPSRRPLGGLYLTSMPGCNQPLEEFFNALRTARVNHILCLVDDEEISAMSPDYFAAIQQDRIPALLKRMPISDMGLPARKAEVSRELDRLRCLIGAGESVVIHCAMGHVRTGMIATMLLLRMGFAPHQAAAIIRQAGSEPGTA